jgi:hypothetical protein
MNAHRLDLTALVLLVTVSACENSTSSGQTMAPAAAETHADTATAAVAERDGAPGTEPEIASMALAAPVSGGKTGVPIDVRYLLAGVAAKDQPAPLDVAFVPRIDGTNLEVSFIGSDSTSVDAGATSLFVARAGTSSIHRRRLTVTPNDSDVGAIRVQVMMDVAGGRYSSIFVIPVSARATEANAER